MNTADEFLILCAEVLLELVKGLIHSRAFRVSVCQALFILDSLLLVYEGLEQARSVWRLRKGERRK